MKFGQIQEQILGEGIHLIIPIVNDVGHKTTLILSS